MSLGSFWLLLTNLSAIAVPSLVNEGICLVEGQPATRPLWGLVVDEPSVTGVAVVIAALAALGAVVRTASRVTLFNVGRDIERALRAGLFSHLATLSPTFYRQHAIGDLMSRLTNDLTNVRLLAGFALLNSLNAIIIFVMTLPLLLRIHAPVAVVSLLPFPLVILSSQLVSKAMFRRTRENQDAIGALSTSVQESLSGQEVVRGFSQEEAVERRFGVVNERVFVAAMRLAHVRLLMGPLMGLMGSLAVALALFFGGRAVVRGEMRVGDLVEINTRILQLTWPTIALGFVVSVWQRGKASLSRINDLLVVQPDIVDGAVQRTLQGKIELRGLTVQLGDRQALSGVSLDIAAGSVIGFVGRNGSGKSTLVKALARLVPVERGAILLDDVDANDWHLQALHRGIGVVPEDGFLFSATLRENLAFGRPDASEEEVQIIVDLVDLRRDVDRFPQGLDTPVGERGVTLSGGQRQRVALGRALLARPRILILDDSLSAVDAETEQNIAGALREGFGAAAPPTTLIISHRLSAVRHADQIIGLADGRIVEQGRHDELLARGGLYAALWGEQEKKERLARQLEGAS